MSDEVETRLMQAHAAVLAAYQQLAAIRPLLEGASSDTSFAVGEAAGCLSKAKALIGRDIDQIIAANRVAENGQVKVNEA